MLLTACLVSVTNRRLVRTSSASIRNFTGFLSTARVVSQGNKHNHKTSNSKLANDNVRVQCQAVGQNYDCISGYELFRRGLLGPIRCFSRCSLALPLPSRTLDLLKLLETRVVHATADRAGPHSSNFA